MTEERSPISLPTYTLGDEGKSNHFDASTSRETAATEAKSLSVGDAAFILRTDGKWTYAIVTEKIEMKEPEDCIGCPYKDGPTLGKCYLFCMKAYCLCTCNIFIYVMIKSICVHQNFF